MTKPTAERRHHISRIGGLASLVTTTLVCCASGVAERYQYFSHALLSGAIGLGAGALTGLLIPKSETVGTTRARMVAVGAASGLAVGLTVSSPYLSLHAGSPETTVHLIMPTANEAIADAAGALVGAAIPATLMVTAPRHETSAPRR